ncbi:hypothetical protein E8E13_006375 [Curvularia kusanoi]|uniref:Uncharacterized protein n=1 Tax=Curvularia kusanoi TaxID=90978 RepID=A0A9P4TGF6_CURKU|nr:hypothetical protein E8E13_006375 [Curvularia kusanoi]
MGKPGLGLFTGRRKSQSNVLEEVSTANAPASPDAAASAVPLPPSGDSGGFRLMSRQEVEKQTERRKTMEKEKKSAFPRFSGFGSNGNKARHQSFEDESPGSSKRDSKSSSGTQFSTSRPYINGQHGSTSTLPSSTDTGSDDNLFANVPRPQIPHHSSSPGSYFSSKKSLPALPKTSSGAPPNNSNTMPFGFGKRDRAMTTSSYASTAMPPKLDQDLSFGEESSFDDIFSGINRKASPEMSRQPEPTGRSLLAEKRTFQPDPIKVLPQMNVEPPLRSWDSRGSADNLMDSPRSDNESPPVPPPHKYQQYAPVSMAPDSPDLQSSAGFRDRNGQAAREPFMRGGSTSPEQNNTSKSTSSANSFETPLSSRSASTSATPKAPLPPSAIAYDDNDEDNMFAPPPPKAQAQALPVPKPTPTVAKNPPRPTNGSRVMSQAEFREYQKKRAAAPPPEDSESEEDYEDEEDAIKKREEEEVLRRKNQQMSFAREAMRRSTTAPGDPNRPESIIDNAFNSTMGFPSETSMKADEWEDEDVPLGILAQHGFPSTTRNRVPSQPVNAIPSAFPDRPASAGAMGGNRASHLPAFARNLPMDPHNSFIGGGLVHHANRESLGFNNFPRGPASVAGDMPAPLMYNDAGMSAPSLVDQIQMRDMTKKKYLGGASNKKPVEGPFTGMLGNQMNAQGQSANPMRMSQMPMMNGGMNGMNGGMNPMMMGGMGNPMMGMGMGQMGFMPQQQDFMQMQQQYQQMQQMMAMQFQQMQMQQMQQQQQQQDPRMSMAMPNNMFNNGMMGQSQNMMGNNSFLNVPGMQNGMQPPQNRPMSIMSSSQRPFSTFGGGLGMGPGPGYTPSIAPSERSNIGLSARYRPVTNHSDAVSNGTSMTLQATGGGANKSVGGATIKGILKKSSPQIHIEEKDDEEDWGSLAARKSKFIPKGKDNSSNLEDLTRGLNI